MAQQSVLWTRSFARSASSLGLLILLSGCLGSVTPDLETRSVSSASSVVQPVVVGLIDSEINPYRPEFAARSASASVEAVVDYLLGPDGQPPELVRLASRGDLTERAAADAEFWRNVEPNRLYAFEGTRVLAVTVREADHAYIFAGSGNGHGTPTSSLIARDAPDAMIVMVVVGGGFCVPDGRSECYVDPSYARAMDWLSRTAAVDIISVSQNLLLNEPQSGDVHPEARAYLAASRAAAARGALIVNGAGNYASATVPSYFAGPPWVIAVGGFEPGQQGESAFAARASNVVANFTEEIAIAGSLNETTWASGTSYATPIVAGTLAHALGIIRTTLSEGPELSDGELASGRVPGGEDLHVVSGMLRDALNATAVYARPTDWQPANDTAPFDPLLFWTRTSVPVVAPPVQMGWGYVHAGLAEEIARRVLEQDTSVPPEKATAAAWMATVQGAREQYWATWPG